MESIEQTEALKSPPEEYQFHFEGIENLREPIEKILSQLYDDIEAGAYQLITGDDASGRIPALILNNVIKARYRAKGYSDPEMNFVAGVGSGHSRGKALDKTALLGRTSLVRQIKDRILAGGGELKGALIVTDIIETGNSLRPLVEALENEGVSADIAAVFATRGLESIPGCRVVDGGGGASGIYKQYRLSGVKKNVGDLFAEPYKKVQKHDIPPGDIQKDINNAREDVGVLSDALINWYNGKLANKE